MKISRSIWSPDAGWAPAAGSVTGAHPADLVLAFGATAHMKNGVLKEVKKNFPKAYICGCSTAGEISGARVLDDSLCVTAVHLEHTKFRAAVVSVNGPGDSFSAGEKLVAAIPPENLVHAFVLSDGLCVNGSELVKGITSRLPAGVAVTGGLSGDGARFAETYVCADGEARQKQVVLIGFYGNRLRVGCASMGGWDSFGPERRITRSAGNVLYELDGKSALELYKNYLGPHASGLPASGLLFPLAVRDQQSGQSVVRTILAVDEKQQSMTFAGDVPQGGLARLMRANFDRLVDGAAGAAKTCRRTLGDGKTDLAILISCVGRKLVLKQRIEEEVEAVLEVLGHDAVATGFYSYGEISPFTPEARCNLHNQTMTVTTFTEV